MLNTVYIHLQLISGSAVQLCATVTSNHTYGIPSPSLSVRTVQRHTTEYLASGKARTVFVLHNLGDNYLYCALSTPCMTFVDKLSSRVARPCHEEPAQGTAPPPAPKRIHLRRHERLVGTGPTARRGQMMTAMESSVMRHRSGAQSYLSLDFWQNHTWQGWALT